MLLFLTIEFFSYIVKTDIVDIHAFLASGTSLHHFIEVKIALSSSATTKNMNKLNKNCKSPHSSLFIVFAKFELKVHIFYFVYNIFHIYLHQTIFFLHPIKIVSLYLFFYCFNNITLSTPTLPRFSSSSFTLSRVTVGWRISHKVASVDLL